MFDMANIFGKFLSLDGQSYQIERNHKVIASCDGLDNYNHGNNSNVEFPPGTDVRVGDWLINTSNERFYIHDVKTVFIERIPNSIQAFYETESLHNRNKKASVSNIFNVSNVTNSVIGNYNSATISYNDALSNLRNDISASDSEDKAELQEIVTLLEMMVNEKVPVSKGILSKFSDVMERNSWITSSIAGVILSWLMNRI